MAVITISRELAALGDDIAKELGRKMSYRFVNRQAIEERIKSYGVSKDHLQKYDERKPSLFASISEERDEYLHYLKQALFDEAQEGNCILMGRGAFALFRGLPALLPVFLVSPMNIRIERVRSYFRCDVKRAKQIIAQSDSDRAGFHRYFFESDWKDPENYYITINTSSATPAVCAETIAHFAGVLFDEEAERASRKKLKELALAQAVVHHILYEKKIAIYFLDASLSGTTVTLYGVANSVLMVDAALAAALEVPSVEKAVPEIQIAQDYSVMP
ncbi:MAG: cytidylate kinase-like family protein [Spirochaetaceae bacterium]|nr:cytidylate kinase-like family protein [Spirochaetaceae bacterium]